MREDRGQPMGVRRGHRRYRKIRPLRLLLIILAAVVVIGGAVGGAMAIFSRTGASVPVSNEPAEPVEPELPDESVPADTEINSRNAYLLRREDGAVLFSLRPNERVYPASVTKIMTALIALEHSPDLSSRFTVTEEIMEQMEQSSSSLAGFEAGEEATVKDLLAGTLLASGGEAALTLAVNLAGSEEAFVAWMNERAEELGMQDTHFTNVSGLHDENHYTSVQDMATLLDTALDNNTFYQLFTAKSYVVPATNMHPEGFTMRSTLFEGVSSEVFTGGEILGGKTGTTTPAGQCLASLARKNGREYILVTMGAHGQADYLLSGEDALLLYGAIGESTGETAAEAASAQTGGEAQDAA